MRTNITERDYSIDFLRGSAIFFMLITHINAIFYRESTGFLDNLTFWGATVCFTIFLFCFAYVYGIKLSKGFLEKQKSLKRIWQLFLVYYVTAFSAAILLPEKFQFPRDIFNILIFKKVPEYTEFLIAFALFAVLIYLFQNQLKRIAKKPWLLIGGSIVIYAASIWLNKYTFGNNYLTDLKGLLIGNDGWHRFPVLIYLPIFTFGYLWGYFSQEIKTRKNINLVVFISTFILFWILRLTSISTWIRWPASVLFLLYGIIYIFALFTAYKYVRKFKLLNRFGIFLGQNALTLFILNVFVLLGVSNLLDFKRFSQFQTIGLNILFITLLSLLTWRWTKIKVKA